MTTPRNLWLLPLGLTLVCTLLQQAAWLKGWRLADQPGAADMLGLAEMGLMLALLYNGWRIRQSVLNTPNARQAATWSLASLALCVLGDLVNRNFQHQAFAHDAVVEHSYLVNSVWFFLPGYLLWLVLAWRVTDGRVSARTHALSLLATCLGGLISFGALVLPGVSGYTAWVTGAYSPVITSMLAAALWLWLAFGRRAAWVCIGAVLAAVADALIAQFWLYGQGHYPGVAHLNFVVYFASQALIQQLALVLPQKENT